MICILDEEEEADWREIESEGAGRRGKKEKKKTKKKEKKKKKKKKEKKKKDLRCFESCPVDGVVGPESDKKRVSGGSDFLRTPVVAESAEEGR